MSINRFQIYSAGGREETTMRKAARRDLERAFPEAIIKVTSGGHYKLVLPNNRFVIVASTASDWRSMLNARRDVRKQFRMTTPPR